MSTPCIVIGIDGGDLDILAGLHLPTFDRLFSGGFARSLKFEKFYRGWPVILTGDNPDMHGGMYCNFRPDSYRTHDRFSMSDYDRSPCVPLWRRLNQQGHSVGFMNVPTTFPAPEVDGFFISGGGGGQPLAWPRMGYPPQTESQLSGSGYIGDVRLKPGSYTSFGRLLEDLSKMTRMRGEQFLKMMRAYQPDLGFVCFVAPDRIQHALFRNMEDMAAGANDVPHAEPIRDCYLELDAALDAILREYEGANIVLISDHGHAPYRRNIDLNYLLSDYGFLDTRTQSAQTHRQTLRKMIKSCVPAKLRPFFRGAAPRLSSTLGVSRYKTSESRAFSVQIINGVYVNEQGRFPDGTTSRDDCDRIISDVIAAIADASTPDFPMKARPFRALHAGTPHEQFLPDVVVDFPEDTFMVRSLNDGFLQNNEYYGTVEDDVPTHLNSVISGIHSSTALFAVHGPGASSVEQSFPTWELDEFYGFLCQLLA